MTRNTAREIAAHLAYEWNFTDLPVGEFLDRRLAPECFAELAPECGLYADAPNAKQAAVYPPSGGGRGGPCGGAGRLHRPVRTGLALRTHPSDGLCRHAGGHV